MNGNFLDICKQLNISEDNYFLTGSKALDNESINYKISSDNSDYDYVLNIHERHNIISYLNSLNITIDYSCYNGGFKYSFEGKTYNIITCINIEFMAWRESLKILKELIQSDEVYRNVIKNKNIRYSIYEQLRAICKSLITLNEHIK